MKSYADPTGDNPSRQEEFKRFLQFLWRGGRYGYLWTVAAGTGIATKATVWLPVAMVPKYDIPAPWYDPASELRAHVYFGVHPTVGKRDRFSRGRLEDIACVNCLFAEFDVKDWGSKSAIRKHVIELSKTALPPSAIVDSGGGYHLYWLLRRPYIIMTAADTGDAGARNDPQVSERREYIAQLQTRWVAAVRGDPGAKDLARVLRVPGTRNFKPAYAPDYPVVTMVMNRFDVLYDVSDFERAMKTIPPAGSSRNAPGGAGTGRNGRVNKSINGSNGEPLAPAIPEIIPRGQRNRVLTSIAGTMRARGLERDEILAALRVINQKRCRPPLPDREVVAIVNSVMRYAPSRPAMATAGDRTGDRGPVRRGRKSISVAAGRRGEELPNGNPARRTGPANPARRGDAAESPGRAADGRGSRGSGRRSASQGPRDRDPGYPPTDGQPAPQGRGNATDPTAGGADPASDAPDPSRGNADRRDVPGPGGADGRDVPGAGGADDGGPERQIIDVTGARKSIDVEDRVAAEILSGMTMAGGRDPEWYRRNGVVVTVQEEPSTERAKGLRLSASILDVHLAKADIAKRFDVRAIRKTPDGSELAPATLSETTVKLILAKGTRRGALPELNYLVSFPFFDRDGRLNNRSGYYPQSGTFLRLPRELESIEIPTKPSGTEVSDAVAFLGRNLLGDFPYVDTADSANAFGFLISPIVRPMVQGRVPLMLVTKPTPGTGASLLVTAISTATTGSPPAMLQESTSDELRKAITSVLVSAAPIVLLDNVRVKIPDRLAELLTAELWTDRILGKTEMIAVEPNSIFTATGINAVITDEMVRRVIPIRLDAKIAEPWSRRWESFAQPNLLQWIRNNRRAVMEAICIVVQNWIARDRPEWQPEYGEKPILGGFDDYVETVGAILETAGIQEFGFNLREFASESDLLTGEILSFLEAWWSDPRAPAPNRSMTVAELMMIIDNPENDIQLPLGNVGNEKSREISLGKLLARIRGKVFVINDTNGEPVEILVQKEKRSGRVGRKWSLTMNDQNDEMQETNSRNKKTQETR